MLRLRDLLSGKLLLGRRPTPSGSLSCRPDLPKDPPPVKPGEPWCDVGPALKVGKRPRRRNKRQGAGSGEHEAVSSEQ
jgi:hypothetical protein